MKNFLKLVTSIIIATLAGANDSSAKVIYQAFNERFAEVEAKLPALKVAGYAAVQISPPQMSHESEAWWGRYQPRDFRQISGPLGSETELRDLITAAHNQGLNVLVDAVLNHMASSSDLSFPQFSPRDFHLPESRECIRDYSDRHQVINFWLCSGPDDPGLPDLDTSSLHVRSVHRTYLQKLVDLGVDGFRFDAARHIEPDYFADILSSLPRRLYNYGEIISSSQSEISEYQYLMDVTDFKLLSTMINAFSPNGDLSTLVHSVANQTELTGTHKVVFARNHDSAMNPQFYNFRNLQDSRLATAYVLARGIGIGFVYRDDAFDPAVIQAMRFHNQMEGRSVTVRAGPDVCGHGCDSRSLLFVERGDEGLAVLNSADHAVSINYLHMSALKPGCYDSSGTKISFTPERPDEQTINRLNLEGKNQSQVQPHGFVIPPRSLTFLVKSKTEDCH